MMQSKFQDYIFISYLFQFTNSSIFGRGYFVFIVKDFQIFQNLCCIAANYKKNITVMEDRAFIYLFIYFDKNF